MHELQPWRRSERLVLQVHTHFCFISSLGERGGGGRTVDKEGRGEGKGEPVGYGKDIIP